MVDTGQSENLCEKCVRNISNIAESFEKLVYKILYPYNTIKQIHIQLQICVCFCRSVSLCLFFRLVHTHTTPNAREQMYRAKCDCYCICCPFKMNRTAMAKEWQIGRFLLLLLVLLVRHSHQRYEWYVNIFNRIQNYGCVFCLPFCSCRCGLLLDSACDFKSYNDFRNILGLYQSCIMYPRYAMTHQQKHTHHQSMAIKAKRQKRLQNRSVFATPYNIVPTKRWDKTNNRTKFCWGLMPRTAMHS